jgi:hypothetical protein
MAFGKDYCVGLISSRLNLAINPPKSTDLENRLTAKSQMFKPYLFSSFLLPQLIYYLTIGVKVLHMCG